MAVLTDKPLGFDLPYATGASSTEPVNGLRFGIRLHTATVVSFMDSESEAFFNGPIVLGESAFERFREILAQGRRPLPAPPAARSDALPAR